MEQETERFYEKETSFLERYRGWTN